jgi:HlyD family type I secretion membrane fusion protein
MRGDELKSSVTLATERIAELELKIQDLETRYTEEAVSKLGEVRQSIMDLRERLRPAEDACRRLEITAPESGVVVNLNVRTEGGVIQGGQPLMEIVPRDSGLIVSAMVAPDKIDEVKTGQRASVSLSAFPTRHTPKVDGTVIYVSADRVEPKTQYIPPHYLVHVALNPASLNAAIKDVGRLTPGMPAEVYIQTEAKTILDYLLTPITESMNRALRE